jgi:Sulfotransferase family
VAADCEHGVRQRLRAHLRMRFAAREHADSRTGAPPRLFDASPRNALMVPFLDAVFPDATFIYIHRRPVDALAESLAIWRAGSATTYTALPGWSGPRWSFLLVPGWQELNRRPLAEVVTEQWVRTMRTLIADLEGLSPLRWCVTDHDALLQTPAAELARLSGFLGLTSSAVAATAFQSAGTRFDPAAARAARSEVGPYLARVKELADRADEWIAPRGPGQPGPPSHGRAEPT